MKRDVRSPAAYRKSVDTGKRELLETLRTLVLEAAPDAEEGIRYGMLDYPGLANLAAQKDYVALYVVPAVLAERKDDFAGVSCGKSCLRFRRVEQVDQKAVRRLLREVRAFRAREERAG